MTTTSFAIPQPDEYHEYYQQYISKFAPENFPKQFAAQADELRQTLGSLDPSETSRLHEPYTWTLKQVVGHLIDVERIFSVRMLRIGVGDETPIPGIDQNVYVNNMDYDCVSMDVLLDEFELIRKSNLLLAQRMPAEAFDRRGIASDNSISARANLFILGGHVVYHLEIIKKRLGLSDDS